MHIEIQMYFKNGDTRGAPVRGMIVDIYRHVAPVVISSSRKLRLVDISPATGDGVLTAYVSEDLLAQ